MFYSREPWSKAATLRRSSLDLLACLLSSSEALAARPAERRISPTLLKPLARLLSFVGCDNAAQAEQVRCLLRAELDWRARGASGPIALSDPLAQIVCMPIPGLAASMLRLLVHGSKDTIAFVEQVWRGSRDSPHMREAACEAVWDEIGACAGSVDDVVLHTRMNELALLLTEAPMGLEAAQGATDWLAGLLSAHRTACCAPACCTNCKTLASWLRPPSADGDSGYTTDDGL